MKRSMLLVASFAAIASLAACTEASVTTPMIGAASYDVIAANDYVCTLNSSFVVTVYNSKTDPVDPYPRTVSLVLNAGTFVSGTTIGVGYTETVDAASIAGLTFTFTGRSLTYFLPGSSPPEPNIWTVTGAINPLTGNVDFTTVGFVDNWLPDRDGLAWKADNVATCVLAPPATCDSPAAPAIANAYLKANNISVGSAKGKAITSEVSKHMGPGATFNGLAKCDPGYAAAVQAFVQSLL
jgi:hypothetical protein